MKPTANVIKILTHLLEDPRTPVNGSELAKAVDVRPDPVYKTLDDMDREGWAHSEYSKAVKGQKRRLMYVMTSQGIAEGRFMLREVERAAAAEAEAG